jgi:hypothetical protein
MGLFAIFGKVFFLKDFYWFFFGCPNWLLKWIIKKIVKEENNKSE